MAKELITAKEKAQELIDKYLDILGIEAKSRAAVYAKSCALICVEEIHRAIDFDWMEVQNLDREHNFWVQVKEEINKMLNHE